MFQILKRSVVDEDNSTIVFRRFISANDTASSKFQIPERYVRENKKSCK